MILRIVSQLEDFINLRVEWNRIYNETDASFFQSYSFNYYSWCNTLSCYQLAIIILEDNIKGIVGILPFYIKDNVVRLINDIHADYCDALVAEDIDLDFENILSCLNSKGNNKYRFSFINLRRDSFLYKMILKSNICNSVIKKYSSFFFLDIMKNSFPYNHSRLSSKQKVNIRRVKNNVEGSHSILSNDNGDFFPDDDIIYLIRRMVSNNSRNTSFMNDNFISLLKDLYLSDLLIISIIKSENDLHRVNAISFILRKDNDYLIWIDLFDKIKMINIFNYIHMISLFTTTKDCCIHFGRGLYNYKKFNFNPVVGQLYAVHIFNNIIALNFYIILNYLKDKIRHLYYFLKS